MALLKKKKIW